VGLVVLDIDHVQLAAPKNCEAAARVFFGELLGLTEVEKPAPLRGRGGCWFAVGARQLHIGVEEPFLPSRKAHPAFAVADIQALFERLQRSHIECSWDAELEGRRRFFAADPWGNRLEFTEPMNTSSIGPAG
jgi:catechol 2,3-dioxygenase-like lactoylglutathione lyase family enzyme